MLPDPIEADVVIVGGGPAGLSAGIALKRGGLSRVIVLERDVVTGGIPRQCGHPPYGVREFGRLMTGPTYAARLRAEADAHGVELRTRHSVIALGAGGLVDVASPDGPSRWTARRVLLATGARETPRSARLVSGDRPQGVVNTATLQDAIYLKRMKPFARPVLVGTELVGLSAIWTCLTHGIRPAAVIEAAPHAIARWPLGLFPRIVGIPIFYRAGSVEIVGGRRVEAVRIMVDGQTREIACDGVILTGRFTPEASLLRAGHLAIDPATGGPVVDQHGRCSDPAFFACGNLLRPIETASWCFREGQRVAHAVLADLAGGLDPASTVVEAGKGVRWIVPQRIGGAIVAAAQLRASVSVNGRLAVRQSERLIWSRRVRARAERRLSIPPRVLRRLDGDAPVVVSIEP